MKGRFATPGLGIPLGIFVSSSLTKCIARMVREAFDDVPQKEPPQLEINVGDFFEAMNQMLPVLIAGRKLKIVAIRPATKTKWHSPKYRDQWSL